MTTIDLWQSICDLDDLLPDCGVAALLDGRQIALFKVGSAVYAIDNFDPNSRANVLARGIVGDIGGEPVVASPVYKQHFSLITGRCLEDIGRSVRSWPVRVHGNRAWVRSEPRALARRRKLVVIGNGMAGM